MVHQNIHDLTQLIINSQCMFQKASDAELVHQSLDSDWLLAMNANGLPDNIQEWLANEGFEWVIDAGTGQPWSFFLLLLSCFFCVDSLNILFSCHLQNCQNIWSKSGTVAAMWTFLDWLVLILNFWAVSVKQVRSFRIKVVQYLRQFLH